MARMQVGATANKTYKKRHVVNEEMTSGPLELMLHLCVAEKKYKDMTSWHTRSHRAVTSNETESRQRASTCCSRAGARRRGALLMMVTWCLLQQQVFRLGAQRASLEHGELVYLSRHFFVVVLRHCAPSASDVDLLGTSESAGTDKKC